VIWAVAAVGLLAAMVMAMARALLGPTVYDRVLAVNTLGTKTVLLLAVIGFLSGRPDWVDLSLVYALINFAGTIAVLKVVEFGSLGQDTRRREEGR
jgi:multicomponent Na+:H+ antiporter subunit F